MLVNFYHFSHDVLGMCFYTLPAIALGVITAAMAIGHNRNQKKRAEDFADELQEKLGL